MKLSSPLSHSTLRRTAVAVAIAAVSIGASAQTFTLDPAGAGLAGTSFTGDNILISDYSTVRISGTSFTDRGFLAISGIELNGSVLTSASTPGLNSTYGLYIAFDATGTTTAGNPTLVPTSGSFTTLNYSLFGYNGAPATFSVDPTGATDPTENATGEVLLASGSLISGGVATVPVAGGRFLPFAGADVTFSAGSPGFFVAPNPFYNLAFASFSNTTSQVTAFAGGFSIDDGGGAFNFGQTTPIPEPETYALMLAGLGVVGFVARRRRT